MPRNPHSSNDLNLNNTDSKSSVWQDLNTSTSSVDAVNIPDDVQARLLPFTSNFYNYCKNLFLEPSLGYDPMSDPLSDEAKLQYYHDSKMAELLAFERHISYCCKDLNDEISDAPPSQSTQPKGVLTSTSLPSFTKFEEKVRFTVDNHSMTSMVMFHAMLDIIAVSDGNTVGIWSLTSCSKILEVSNRHSSTVQAGEINSPNRPMSSNVNISGTLSGFPSNKSPSFSESLSSSYSSSLVTPRITAMHWINEMYDALLLLGSDDGIVNIWRDSACSDSPSSSTVVSSSAGNVTGSVGGTPTPPLYSSQSSSPGVELVTSFAALPDVAEMSKVYAFIAQIVYKFYLLSISLL